MILVLDTLQSAERFANICYSSKRGSQYYDHLARALSTDCVFDLDVFPTVEPIRGTGNPRPLPEAGQLVAIYLALDLDRLFVLVWDCCVEPPVPRGLADGDA
jgi:hypothetical protein